MKKTLLTLPIAVLAVLSLLSCGDTKTAEQTEAPVTAKVEEITAPAEPAAGTDDQLVLQEAVSFYKSISDGSFNGAVEFLHPKAIEATPKSQWLKLLEDTKAQFGPLKKTNVIDSRKFDGVTTIVGVSDYYQIEFENVYQNGTLYEMLSFVKEKGNAKPKLLSYTYNSDKSKIMFEKF